MNKPKIRYTGCMATVTCDRCGEDEFLLGIGCLNCDVELVEWIDEEGKNVLEGTTYAEYSKEEAENVKN